MPTTLTLDARTLLAMPQHRCFVRAAWADDWQEVSHLYCLQVKWCAAPDIPLAVLESRYGRALQPGSSNYAGYGQNSLAGHYVKVEVATQEGSLLGTWVGVIQEVDNDRRGLLDPGVILPVVSGVQRFHAFGLEVLLRREPIVTSWIRRDADGVNYKIHRGLKVNAENSRSNEGNRSTDLSDLGMPIFTDNLDEAEKWNTLALAEYLLAYHTPRDADGMTKIPFVLGATTGSVLPDWDKPVKELHGLTIERVFNDLIDRGRFVGWYLDYDLTASPNEVRVEAFPFNAANITLPGGGIQLGSGNQVILDIDQSLRVGRTPLKTSLVHNVEQVVVAGERIRCCFTAAPLDETIDEDWSSSHLATYNAGYTADADIDVNQRLTALVRSADALERVFACWKLPDDWDGLVGDGIGGEQQPFLPTEEDVVDTFYRPGLRFLRELPLKVDPSAGEASEWRKPIVLLKLPPKDPGDEEEPSRYQHVDQIGALSKIEGDGDGAGLRWSCHARMAEHDAGIVLTVSGKPRHVLASTDFVPLADIDDEDPAELDWRDNLVCTVAMEADRHVEVWYPEMPAGGDAVRRLRVELGEKARLDYVAPGTVSGITDAGELEYFGEAEYVRDDRPRMADLARMAYEWYSVPRQALALDLDIIYAGLAIGVLIVQLGTGPAAETINAVVTSIEWDLTRGKTRIGTDYADLDLRQLF